MAIKEDLIEKEAENILEKLNLSNEHCVRLINENIKEESEKYRE
jgi:hypothetical protein